MAGTKSRRETLLVVVALLIAAVTPVTAGDHVVLLHGLGRTDRSMKKMERALRSEGYQVVNVRYPSRNTAISKLAETHVADAVAKCRSGGATQIHFVAHSMGGILVRAYLEKNDLAELGKVVMLGPPNQGSEVVDAIGESWLFGLVSGQTGRELGTDAKSVPNRLGAAKYPVGIIAGAVSVNPINSFFIPGKDDGKVSVARTKVEGMTDHLVLNVPHPFLMTSRRAITATLQFLRNGCFGARSDDTSGNGD